MTRLRDVRHMYGEQLIGRPTVGYLPGTGIVSAKSRYVFGIHYRTEKAGDSGQADTSIAWRCECGAKIDCESESCFRCGSEKPGEWR